MTDICIITRLKDNKFQNLLKSIADCTCRSTLDNIRILVSYNGDDDEAIKAVQKQSPVKFEWFKDTYNFAKNCNMLAKIGEGTSDKLLFLNDDVELKTDAITHCINILDDNPVVGTVGIKLLFPDGTIQHGGHILFCKDRKFVGVSHLLLKQQDRKLNDIFTVGNTGAFLMLRRSDFNKVGGFDERFERCFEDVVLNWKILISGKINATALSQTAIHHESTTRDRAISQDDINLMVDFFNENIDRILYFKDVVRPTIQEIK